jgi:hypothetical protein
MGGSLSPGGRGIGPVLGLMTGGPLIVGAEEKKPGGATAGPEVPERGGWVTYGLDSQIGPSTVNVGAASILATGD